MVIVYTFYVKVIYINCPHIYAHMADCLPGKSHNKSMDWLERFVAWCYRTRKKMNRRRRLIFPSPAEMRLVELMGGKVIRLQFIRDPFTHFPVAFVASRGSIFRAERVRREVQIAGYSVDFCNDLFRIIEVDGAAYHMDVVADMEREIYIKQYCQNRKMEARFLRIKATEITRSPAKVQQKVMRFLAY